MNDVVQVYKGYFKHLEDYKELYCAECFNNANSLDEKGKTVNISVDIVNQLVNRNKKYVMEEIKKGNRNIKELLEIISRMDMSTILKRVMEFTFVGIRITTDCNLYGSDRCTYCDQKHYKGKLNVRKLKEILESISNNGKRRGINVSLSGGEPLLLYEDLFGKGELIKFCYENGYIVNMNSNLHLVTPQSVLPIINSGLASIHTSFDSSVEFVHDKLVCQGAMNRAIEGIKYIQHIKKIFNVFYPVVHINVVATKENLLLYDKLLKFLLQYRMGGKELGLGTPYTNPERMDLSPHLIPLGGSGNKKLMPDVEEWTKFEDEILPKCREIWNEYLNNNGIELTRKNTFDVIHYYSNPLKFNAVNQVNEKKEYRKCYLAPSQIYIVNNGDCYTCGAHADIKNAPVLGNIYENSIDEIINKNIYFLNNELPHPEFCRKCAKNTRKLNAVIENRLIASLQAWINKEEQKHDEDNL